MKSFTAVALVAGIASALPGDSYGAPAESWGAPATTTYACNPAHSYPNGATCISTAGSLTLVTPASSAPATTTGYACNPAHSYPNGATCISTAGSLTLVTPSSSAAATTTYACNPAHAYPNGASCISTAGSLTLVTPSASASASASTTAPAKGGKEACYDAYNKCRVAPDANMSFCAAKYEECLGYNPFNNNGTNTMTPKQSDTYTTEVVTKFTTYCPEPTTLTYQDKTYTVTKATTLTISDCPCTVTKPVKSTMTKPTGTAVPPKSDTYTTEVVTKFTTYCPEPTTLTYQDKTYTVTEPTTLTISDCPCTVTKPVSMPPTTKSGHVGTVAPTGDVPVNAPSQTVSAPASTRSTTQYTGAADKLNVGGALMIGALGLFAL